MAVLQSGNAQALSSSLLYQNRAASPQGTAIHFISCLTVWGVEPDVTHQTPWLGSTGECGRPQNQVGEHFAQRRA